MGLSSRVRQSLDLVFKNLRYYWRTNIAVVLGVVAGTAVIGGALVVGDSVRESLRRMSLDRLGDIDHVIHAPRFFREELVDEIAKSDAFTARFESAAPALLMQGSIEYDEFGDVQRANRISIYGLDERLWELTQHGEVERPVDREVVLSHRVAEQLNVREGSEVSMWLELPSNIPRDSILGERDELSKEIVLTVKTILPEDMGLGRLDLNPNQQLPLNAYASLDSLQDLLDLAEFRDRRTRTIKPARVNAVFFKAKSEPDSSGEAAVAAAEELTGLTTQSLDLTDLGLRVVENDKFGYLSVESEQMVLESAFEHTAQETAKALKLPSSPVLVYLANELVPVGFELNEQVALERKELDQPGYSMYAVVAGIDFTDAPFAPWQTLEGQAVDLAAGKMVINDFLQQQLNVNVGDKLRVRYHMVGSHGELPEEEAEFEISGVVKLDGPAADRGLTPEVEGVTNARTFADWDKPFDMKTTWLTDKDEEFWGDKNLPEDHPSVHRATPKAFISLADAQKLWQSRYGKVTSLRVAMPEGDNAKAVFVDKFRELLKPASTGLVVQPVKWSGLQASVGANDFSGLFFGFSFFLILSATILIGLLFRLGIERRASEVGLLSAVGFSMKQVRRLLLVEGFIVVLVGGTIGMAGAVAYAKLMVYGLKTWWIGAIGTKFLFVHLSPMSLVVGFDITIVIMMFVIWRSLRQLGLVSTRDLLTGNASVAMADAEQAVRNNRARKTAIISVSIAAVCLIVGLIPGVASQEAFGGFSIQVVVFFLVGMSLLVASLSSFSAWLQSDRSATLLGGGLNGMRRLGVRNAARNKRRSVLTAALIASAAFVIVAVAAGHRNPINEKPDKSTGNGGFSLVAESSQPILFDLNTEDGRDKLDFKVEAGSPAAELVDGMTVVPFRVKPGEDASCLNLYQTRLPTILGVPPQMYERGGFRFADTRVDDPWSLLKEVETEQTDAGSIPVIPVLGDLNTLQYSLKKGIGSTISVPDDDAPEYKLKVVGMFDASVFQGVLLMDGEAFDNTFTDVPAGYQYFLIDVAQQADFEPDDPDLASKRAALEKKLDNATFKMYHNRGRPDSTKTRDESLWLQRNNVLAEIDQLRSPADRLATVLETELSSFGFDTEPVSVRLAAFLAVQNTYLSTFQTLGGLGLLLGTLGLATVMLRNVLERRSELALMRAVGFRNAGLGWLVLFENTLLLVWGLAAGTIAALLAMSPHLLTRGADFPWQAGAVTLGLVIGIGLLAAVFAVREAVRTPILSTLRTE